MPDTTSTPPQPDARGHQLLADDAASAWMGVDVERVGHGEAVITMQLRDEMLNGFGIAHGGMIFAFADTAFALACNDPAADGSTITVASGADINFLRPAHGGQRLRAHARAVSTGRSGVYDVTVTAHPAAQDASASPVVVAEFRGRSRTIPAPAAPTTP